MLPRLCDSASGPEARKSDYVPSLYGTGNGLCFDTYSLEIIENRIYNCSIWESRSWSENDEVLEGDHFGSGSGGNRV